MALMGEVILLGILLFRSAGRWSWFAARRLSCFVAFLNFKLNNLKLKSNIPQNAIFVVLLSESLFGKIIDSRCGFPALRVVACEKWRR
jgi:hypothetical protein